MLWEIQITMETSGTYELYVVLKMAWFHMHELECCYENCADFQYVKTHGANFSCEKNAAV